MNKKIASKSLRPIIGYLAIRDLAHEWLLSACVILIITSILSPLLLLFSIKTGAIQTLRDRLLTDPRTREIRPVENRALTKEQINSYRKLPDVEYVIPMTRQISASADLSLSDSSTSKPTRVALLATSSGDPILTAEQLPVPTSTDCVLSQSAAEAIQARVGDLVQLSVSRHSQTTSETATTKLRITGIVSHGIQTAYVSLDILEQIEAYRDGLAAPLLNWPGGVPYAYPMYSSLLVSLKQPISELEKAQLTANTGVSQLRDLTRSELSEMFHEELAPAHEDAPRIFFQLSNTSKNVTEDSIKAVQQKLKGQEGVVILPFSDGVVGKLNTTPVTLLGMTPEFASFFLKPVKISEVVDSAAAVEMSNGPSFPVQLKQPLDASGLVFLPAEVVGTLRLAHSRPIQYNAASNAFLISRKGFSGFRMYAKTLESVTQVAKHFRQQGFELVTQEDRIRDVLRLDFYVTRLFWLIAAVGLVGGIAALASNMYSAIERKREPLNILRLLGVKRLQLVGFPIVQSLVLSVSGFGCSYGLYVIISKAVQLACKSWVQTGERICQLDATHLGISFSLLLGVSVFVALLASVSIFSTEPSEAIRKD